jgi:hypothetical protein
MVYPPLTVAISARPNTEAPASPAFDTLPAPGTRRDVRHPALP